MNGLFDAAKACFACTAPATKLSLTRQAFDALQAGRLPLDDDDPPDSIGAPGRPERPRLVLPRQVPQRGLGSSEGRAALVHAIAHIGAC